MKNISLLLFVVLMPGAIFSQSNLEEVGQYHFGFDALPDTTKLKLSENFILDGKNHPLDSIQGSLSTNVFENSLITIKKEKIGRIVFYAKNEIIADSLYNDNSINGSINIKYFERKVDTLKIIAQENINLRSNWIEYHKNIKIPSINEIQITFSSELSNTNLYFDKLKVKSLSEEGKRFYEVQLRNEQILLSTVNNSNYTEQANAIKSTYEETILPTLFDYRENITNIISFKEGTDLGKTKSELLNPFEYDFFQDYFDDIRERADFSQKLELDNVKSDIDNNSWLDVAGNIVNVISGGGFNSIINIIKNIVNEQTIVLNNKSLEVRKISSRFYINKGGTIKTLKSIVKDEKDQKTLMKRFNEKLVENEMNYKFISRIQDLRIIETNNHEKFSLNHIRIENLKNEIDDLQVLILKEADSKANINKFYSQDGLRVDVSSFTLHFRDNYNNPSVSTVEAFIDTKIQYSIINSNFKELIKKIENTMTNTKTLYDNSFTANSLNYNLFDDISKADDHEKISKAWQEKIDNLQGLYLKSTLLERLKSITKTK